MVLTCVDPKTTSFPSILPFTVTKLVIDRSVFVMSAGHPFVIGVLFSSKVPKTEDRPAPPGPSCHKGVNFLDL